MHKSVLLSALAMAAVSGSVRASVLINEINSDSTNSPAVDYLEYIELYSTTGTTTDLSGLSVLLVNGNGDAVYRSLDLDGFSTDANGYFVVGSNAVTGAGDFTLLGAGNILQNGPDGVALVNGNAADYPNGTVITNAIVPVLADAIVYGTSDAADVGLLAALGETVQFDEGSPTPPSDDADLGLSRLPNGLDSSPFVLAPRTPGGPNVAVPEPATLGLFAAAAAGLIARRRK